MEKWTDKGSVARMIFSFITTINLCIVAFGGDAIAVADEKVYIVASIIAALVAIGRAVYKNNATSRFGKLCKIVKQYVDEFGIEEIYEVTLKALQENFAEEDEEEVE